MSEVPTRARLHRIECDEDELVELPETGIPVRPEHDEHPTPLRKAYVLHRLERASAGRDPSAGRRPRSGPPAVDIHHNLY